MVMYMSYNIKRGFEKCIHTMRERTLISTSVSSTTSLFNGIKYRKLDNPTQDTCPVREQDIKDEEASKNHTPTKTSNASQKSDLPPTTNATLFHRQTDTSMNIEFSQFRIHALNFLISPFTNYRNCK